MIHLATRLRRKELNKNTSYDKRSHTAPHTCHQVYLFKKVLIKQLR